MNMSTMMIDLPTTDKSDVIPSDMPQVPNAEVISNRRATTGTSFSVMSKISKAVMTITAASKMTAYER